MKIPLFLFNSNCLNIHTFYLIVLKVYTIKNITIEVR